MSYDVFLSHSTADKPFVRAMADWLDKHGVTYFLDEKDLLPGDRLTEKLGTAMEASRSAIICIGPHGEGPWQAEEIDSLLNKAIKLSRRKDEFRIIPVLLPDADTSKLRWFLETRLWVNLSKGITDGEAELFRLRHAIMGTAADSPIQDDPSSNPYRGLKAFEEKDAAFFFGRARECRELAAIGAKATNDSMPIRMAALRPDLPVRRSAYRSSPRLDKSPHVTRASRKKFRRCAAFQRVRG